MFNPCPSLPQPKHTHMLNVYQCPGKGSRQRERLNTKQAQLIDEQEKLITSQDQVMNVGFVKMGTKSELKQLGLISGGGLKKKKVEYSNVEQDLFDRVDIRDLHKLDIPGKNPQILTPMPEESYKLEKNGENTVLRILAPDRFWSVSNFLIIQTD